MRHLCDFSLKRFDQALKVTLRGVLLTAKTQNAPPRAAHHRHLDLIRLDQAALQRVGRQVVQLRLQLVQLKLRGVQLRLRAVQLG